MSIIDKLLAASGGSPIAGLFQTDLYAGNGTSQSITNGINLSGDGGLVWIKNRDAADFNVLSNTESGITDYVRSDSNINETAGAGNFVSSANTDGFSIGSANEVNTNIEDFVSWTWKESINFLDVVAYSGNSAIRTIAHNLSAVPDVMMIKKLSGGAFDQPWAVYFSDLGSGDYLSLDADSAPISSTYLDNTVPTSSVFSLGNNVISNETGSTYSAFLFSGENPDIMQIGEYTGNGSVSGPSIPLGWKPQWLLVKAQNAATDWSIIDSSRGTAVRLVPNSTAAEETINLVTFTDSGFDVINNVPDINQNTIVYSYLAIRQQ